MASRPLLRPCPWLVPLVALAVLSPLGARQARACGATFCDAGPSSMPVEQTGETILFAVDGTHVEAHIRIEIDPDTEASRFAWVIPVTALPEFSIGSQRLFENTLAASVPSYGRRRWSEPCNGEDGCGGLGSGGEDDEDDVAATLDVGGGSPEDPQVVLSSTVGAFEVVVLDGGTAEGVMQWLGDNGFEQDAEATPILREYLEEGHLFVALRLATQADVAEVHPIVLRYEGDEPCVPIRLTRVAAQDDLEIRALFLGDTRYASSNYPHVTLNPLKIDWLGLGANYREVVARAVDEPGANGRAFVTEYAGPNLVSDQGLIDERWDAEPFRSRLTPHEAIEELFAQRLLGYVGPFGRCQGRHALVEGLVSRYLPVPPELSFELLCDDRDAYADAVDEAAWDPDAFADDFAARVVEPGLHARDLLATWPYLTRLYTVLSPHEMTVDPMFHPTPELPEQAELRHLASLNTYCDGHTDVALPDGRRVTVLDGQWPALAPDRMPWAETIAYLPRTGAPVVEVDEHERIDELLAEWHAQVGEPRWDPAPECDGPIDVELDGSPGAEVSASGCGCRSTSAPGWGLGLLAAGVLVRRRRRR